MQSGTTSINTNRIYNPIKQGKDHDPNGLFIRNWVPELKDVPDPFIHEPWLMNNLNNSNYLKNTNYLKPITNILESTREARKKISQITKKEGYWEISKKIYIKHGSRKSSHRKKIKTSKRKKRLDPFSLDKQLILDLRI
tara:strand:- start:281 stop:697 length:417 start_codon:yes stop_codon:yes gene_type:complete